MNETITYVGIDAHARELHVAMLVGDAATPVMWKVANEALRLIGCGGRWNARPPGPLSAAMRPGPVALCCSGA